jgi:hypothetical protein
MKLEGTALYCDPYLVHGGVKVFCGEMVLSGLVDNHDAT